MNMTTAYLDESYTEQLRTKNKIVCSYSRIEAFTIAVDQIGAAANYTVVAQPWCLHDTVYMYDEEGFMTTFHLSDDELKELM